MDEYSNICHDVAEQVASEFMDEIEKLKKEVEKWKKEAKYYEDLANDLSRTMYGGV